MIKICPVCGGNEFVQDSVLWDELIKDWGLSAYEVKYINRQQGYHCINCTSNLRSMALAKAILRSYAFQGTLSQFVKTDKFLSLSTLEINHAGSLNQFLSMSSNHKLVEYPEYDMMDLDINTNDIDLILHSDTLEHVTNPVQALKECKRVLKSSGKCIFTVPIIYERMSKSRNGLKNSYHDQSGEAKDFKVETEFGADIWVYVFKAGFSGCVFHSLEFPAGLAVEAIL